MDKISYHPPTPNPLCILYGFSVSHKYMYHSTLALNISVYLMLKWEVTCEYVLVL